MDNNNNKVLFFTNTPPEYRIPLYQILTSLYPITFIFTELDLAKKIYKCDLDNDKMKKIRYHELPKKGGIFKDIRNIILEDGVKCVVIPPLDSLRESIYAYWIFSWAKWTGKKTIYFWGKWESSSKMQPITKWLKNMLQRVVARPIIKKSDYTLGYGVKACEYLVKNGAKKDKCEKVFYSSMSPKCEQTNWKKKYNIPEEKKCVLYFGRVIEKKGLRYLIEAFNELDEKVKSQLWLVIVGDGPDKKQLEDYSKELGLKNITWVGYIHPNIRYNYFSQCEIFVLPTYYYKGSVEAWGMTMNEAMQCGEILIATEAVGSAYELINKKNGYIVKAGDSHSLSRALEDALTKKNRDDVKQENDRLLGIYNYQNSANKFMTIFEKCIGGGEKHE